MKILSVDDSKTMRRIISGGVEVLGYECLEAENGHAALRILENHYQEIVLITLDWNMPEMDGMELLNTIKQDKRYADIPVMMVTALSQKDNVAEAIRAGAKHYLTKPFTQEDLISRMMEALGCGDSIF
ncbi:MAG: PleD family two-component system response regulator [Candidatus Sumerlaeia bacterium]